MPRMKSMSLIPFPVTDLRPGVKLVQLCAYADIIVVTQAADNDVAHRK